MTMDQTTAVVSEQPEAIEEQQIAVPPVVAEVVAVDAGAVPFRFQDDDDIRAHAEQDERLRSYLEKQRLDGMNDGKQRRDKELRLERGTEEVARAYEQHLASKYGFDLDDVDKREAPLFVRANRDRERHDYWRTNTEAVLDVFDVAERSRITAALEQFEGRPDEVETIARQVIDTAVERQSTRKLSGLTLADIPKDSPLWAEVEEFKRSEAEKEFTARAQERETPPAPPRTPVGGVGTQRTRADYANLTPTEIADLPETEYRIAMGYGAA